MNARALSMLLVLSFPVAGGAGAQVMSIPGVHTSADRIFLAQSGETMTEGEVRKVDREAQKITIKHGPISNLDMPPMTMVFRVKDPSLLDKVKTGDRIRFVADRIEGAYTVTRMEPMP